MKARRGSPPNSSNDPKTSKPRVEEDDLFLDAIRLLGTKVTSKESPVQRIPGTRMGPPQSDAHGNAKAPKKAKGGIPSAVTADDARLFEEAMAGLDAASGTAKRTPIPEVTGPVEPAPPPKPFTLNMRVEAELDGDAFAAALDGHEEVPAPEEEPEVVPVATARPEVISDKQFRALLDKGRMRVGADLDLHGMTLLAAHDAIVAFIAECLKDAVKVIRIVHGKGMHSRGEPVLRDLARRLLRGDLSEHVLVTATPPERLGGDGATVCLLRTAAPSRDD